MDLLTCFVLTDMYTKLVNEKITMSTKIKEYAAFGFLLFYEYV